MKGGAHPPPFAALSFPYSNKIPIFCWVDREFSSRRMAQPSLELTRYGDLLHHSRAALTTRLRRLSVVTSSKTKAQEGLEYWVVWRREGVGGQRGTELLAYWLAGNQLRAPLPRTFQYLSVSGYFKFSLKIR